MVTTQSTPPAEARRHQGEAAGLHPVCLAKSPWGQRATPGGPTQRSAMGRWQLGAGNKTDGVRMGVFLYIFEDKVTWEEQGGTERFKGSCGLQERGRRGGRRKEKPATYHY